MNRSSRYVFWSAGCYERGIYSALPQLLAHIPPHVGGLLPLSFCLFHQQEPVREATLDIFNELRLHPVTCFLCSHHSATHVVSIDRCNIPPSSQSFPALCLRATGSRSGNPHKRGRTERQPPHSPTSACLTFAFQSE